MLTSTLPGLPGRTYDTLGVVISSAMIGAIGGGNIEKMFKTIIQQASDMRADAIIDIKITTPGGQSGIVVIIGTAIKVR